MPVRAGVQQHDGFTTITKEAFLKYFANGVAREKAEVLYAVQEPAAASLFGGRTTAAAWRSKPSWYAVSEDGPTIAPHLERFLATRMNAATVELAAGPLSLVSHPDRRLDPSGRGPPRQLGGRRKSHALGVRPLGPGSRFARASALATLARDTELSCPERASVSERRSGTQESPAVAPDCAPPWRGVRVPSPPAARPPSAPAAWPRRSAGACGRRTRNRRPRSRFPLPPGARNGGCAAPPAPDARCRRSRARSCRE